MQASANTDPTGAPDAFHTQTRGLLDAHRVVLFNGELQDERGVEIISRLLLLSQTDPEADIHLWINSPGGSVPMMLAIADTIELIPNDVITVAIGWAASAGQFVLTMGTAGKRFALRHARILLHQGSSGIGGAAADVELQAHDLRTVRDTVLSRIVKATGQSAERVFADSLRDRWFDAEAAIAYGLCDHLIDSPTQLMQPGPGTITGFSRHDVLTADEKPTAPPHPDLRQKGQQP